jgi:undecaprenyl-diphosphatase
MGSALHYIRTADVKTYYFLSRFAKDWILARLAGTEERNDLIKGGIYFACCWHLWFRSDAGQEKRRRAVTSILIAAVFSIVVTRFIAFITPFRLRPMYDPALVHASFPIEIHYNLMHWSSFPSDSAAYFCALAFGIAYLSRRLAVPIALYTAVWVC